MVDKRQAEDARNAFLEWVKSNPKTVAILLGVAAIVVIAALLR